MMDILLEFLMMIAILFGKHDMRGGKREGAGRKSGSIKEESFDDSMSFRCWKDMKKAVKKAAKQAGFSGYQVFFRYIVAEDVRRANKSLNADPESGADKSAV